MARRIGSLVSAFVLLSACMGKGGGSEERRPDPPVESVADIASTPRTAPRPPYPVRHAVEEGELDDALAGVRFVEFDADRDGARLRDAGYGGRYIPRFVVPDASGRASDQRMEGGIKGPGAVDHIVGRLGPVLASAGDR